MYTEKTIKIQVKRKRRQKKESLARWNPKIRHKVNPFVYPVVRGIKILPKYLNTRKKLANWLLDKAGEGHFFVYGYRKGNRGGIYKLVEVKIKRKTIYFDESEAIYDFIYLGGIARFSFWKDRR